MSGWRKRQIMEKMMEPMVEEYFQFLDTLRESGVTNMFGAAPYLQQQFGLDRGEARKVLLEWMESFSQRKDSVVS